MITIVDYGAGNLGSVDKAFKYIGEDVKIAKCASDINRAEALVLPGVGAFGDVMKKLSAGNFDMAITDYIKEDRLFLGVCLGLQMLFEYSEESPGINGLGIFTGGIKRFSNNMNLKIPQMGWNSIDISTESRLFKGIKKGEYVYFVHSYYLQAADEEIVSAKCSYGVKFHAAVEKGNIFATQFHPEKSGSAGLKILENFVKLQKGSPGDHRSSGEEEQTLSGELSPTGGSDKRRDLRRKEGKIR